jgi:hypothetical protein
MKVILAARGGEAGMKTGKAGKSQSDMSSALLGPYLDVKLQLVIEIVFETLFLKRVANAGHHIHSYLRATIGSTRDALLAGM